MRSATVVVAGSSPLELAVRGTLEDWAVDGVVGGSVIWVERGPDEGDAQSIGPGATGPVRLEQYMATRSGAELVRVVVLQVVGDEAHPGIPPHAEAVRTRLDAMKPVTARLALINLMVPATGVVLQREWIMVPPATNLVALPEDCPSDRDFALPLTVDSGLVAHAAFQVASVCGLWSGVDDTPFDWEPGSHADALPDGAGAPIPEGVRLVRGYGRVMVCQDVVDESLELVLRRRIDPGFPPSFVSAQPAPDPTSHVQAVADQVMARPELTLTAFKRTPPPERRRVTLGAAIVAFFQFMWERVTKAPEALLNSTVNAVRDRVERVAQRVIYGPNSIMKIVIGDRAAPAPEEVPDPNRYRDWARRLEESWFAASNVPPTPAVWVDLRRAAFGLIDGSLATGADAAASRYVVSDLGLVVPDPSSGGYFDGSGPVRVAIERTCDPLAAGTAESQLDSAAEERRAEIIRAATAAEKEPDFEADPVLQRIAEQQEALREWLRPRRPAMLWRVGEAMGGRVSRAQDAFGGALDRARELLVDDVASPDEKIAEARARRKRRNRLGSGLPVLSTIPGIIGFLFLGLLWYLILPFLAVGLVLWAISAFFAYMSYQRRVFQLLHEYETGLLDRENALNEVDHYARELNRLRGFYTQYLDWADVVGWLVYHPEGPDPLATGDALVMPTVDRPRAVDVGVGRISEDHAHGLVARVARVKFGENWLSDLCAQYIEATVRRWQVRMSAEFNADPANDVTVGPNSLREFMVGEVRSGRLAAEWLDRLKAAIRESVSEERPADLFRSVDAVTPEGELVEQSKEAITHEFFDAIIPAPATSGANAASSSRRFKDIYWSVGAKHKSAHEEVPYTFLWLPTGLEGAAQGRVEDRFIRELPMEMGEGNLRISALRMDISTIVPAGDLDLFVSQVRPSAAQPVDGQSAIGRDVIG